MSSCNSTAVSVCGCESVCGWERVTVSVLVWLFVYVCDCDCVCVCVAVTVRVLLWLCEIGCESMGMTVVFLWL